MTIKHETIPKLCGETVTREALSPQDEPVA